jgi:primosomal protein N' (replication factor Y)
VPAIARVEPLTTSRNVRGPFDYAMSPELAAGVGVGSLLVVPFGRRRVLGVVVELATESAIEPDRLAAPIAALEQGVPAELVSLAHWIADAYCSTPARALGLVLPPGAGAGGGAPRIRERTALVATLTDAGATALADGARLGPKQREALERLQASPGGSLAAADAGTDHGSLRRLEARGLVTVERVAQRRSPILRAVGAASAS